MTQENVEAKKVSHAAQRLSFCIEREGSIVTIHRDSQSNLPRHIERKITQTIYEIMSGLNEVVNELEKFGTNVHLFIESIEQAPGKIKFTLSVKD